MFTIPAILLCVISSVIIIFVRKDTNKAVSFCILASAVLIGATVSIDVIISKMFGGV